MSAWIFCLHGMYCIVLMMSTLLYRLFFYLFIYFIYLVHRSIAHEINTPLGVALTASGIVQDATTNLEALLPQDVITEELSRQLEDSTDSMTLLVRNIRRAATMIESFKKLVRITSTFTDCPFAFDVFYTFGQLKWDNVRRCKYCRG